MEYFQLNNGVTIPCIGNGPMILGYGKKKFWSNRFYDKVMNKLFYHKLESDKYVKALSTSIQMGFTLIDYSSTYGDGSLVGEAIRKAGVARDKLTLTSRISNNYYF